MIKDKFSEIHTGQPIIKSSDFQKLLGIKIDSKVHFWWSCKNANRKLQAFVAATA